MTQHELSHYDRIVEDIEKEIQHARQIGYDEAHDDAHTMTELLVLVSQQIHRASLNHGRSLLPVMRRYLVRVAATAIATIASLDRRLERGRD